MDTSLSNHQTRENRFDTRAVKVETRGTFEETGKVRCAIEVLIQVACCFVGDWTVQESFRGKRVDFSTHFLVFLSRRTFLVLQCDFTA